MSSVTRLLMMLATAAVIPASIALAAEPAGPPPASPVQATQVPQAPPPRGGAAAPIPALRLVEGQPIELRVPELATDKPAFVGQTRAPYHATTAVNVAVITDQLKAPWALQFLSGGRMLVTQKNGTMLIVDAKGTVSAPISGVPAVNFQGQVGLLDVVLDNNYARNKRIFFSYSENVGPGPDAFTRIVMASASLDEAKLALSNVKVIYRNNSELPRNPNSANQGGRIVMAKDGNLFMTVGDRSLSPPWDMAQRPDTGLGKIIRITPEGAPAPGNPYLNKAGYLPEIYSFGHRSQEGLALDASGQLWETEHGPRGGDELNMIQSGKNYGWPVIVHGIDYPGPMINGGFTEKPGYEQAAYYWDPVIAPSGLVFYNANLFPAWKGSVLVGSLGRQMLDRLTLVNGRVVNEEPLLLDQKARIRDVRVGPDGAVYVLTDAANNAKLLKLTPK